MPDDDTVGRQVGGPDDDAVRPGLARLRVELATDPERAAVGHARDSMTAPTTLGEGPLRRA